jgi:hypothetical protein
MKFCSHCFNDTELQPIIESLGQIEDLCPICQSRRVFIYDTSINTELTESFEELLEIYTPAAMLPTGFPSTEKKLLVTELTERWHIFDKKLSSTDIYNIICAICPDKYSDSPDLFHTPVGIEEIVDDDFLKGNSLLRTYSWDDFVESVKNQNRFHTNHINLSILERYCSYIRKVYKKGSIFFRGRISGEDGIPIAEMGAPSANEATAGRANSAGIRCLYLASDQDTTIHEVRAGFFDYVTIGRFELKEDIVVVDLKAINHISPFIDGCDTKQHAINKEHLNRINMEIGRTLRRSDSILDYIPTQYISDFIKSISYGHNPEYSGIEYNSTINPSGQNTAIFYPDLFDCVDCEVYHIKELKYIKDKMP